MNQDLNSEFNLTREDVMRLTGWSRATLGRKMSQGLPHQKVRSKTKPTPMFRESDLMSFVTVNTIGTILQRKTSLEEHISNSESETKPFIEKQLFEDTIKVAYERFNEELASEIIEKIKSCSPAFFERLVVELLVKMGYGGTLQDAGRAIGRSGDGGIDGFIKEDRLGLDVIYLQAKRWEGNVSRPEVQKFAGALQGQRARKGVFITTSDFTKEARDFAAMIDSKIILISGDELAQLMIDYNVGVSNAAVYEIKKIDSDYFIEE